VPLTTRAVIEAEREVLTACLTDPATRGALLGWLTPQDFCRPEHAATWAAFGALTKAGTPIDYVTVAWECERRNPDYDSPGLPAGQLATMAAQTPGSPVPRCTPSPTPPCSVTPTPPETRSRPWQPMAPPTP
jgi:replicative DNA helicase